MTFSAREIVGTTAFLVGVAAVTAVNHHPVTGRHTARDVAAIRAAAAPVTHRRIARAWTLAKIGNAAPLLAIEHGFPLPVRTVHEDTSGVVFTFAGHQGTCIDLTSRPQGALVSSRHC